MYVYIPTIGELFAFIHSLIHSFAYFVSSREDIQPYTHTHRLTHKERERESETLKKRAKDRDAKRAACCKCEKDSIELSEKKKKTVCKKATKTTKNLTKKELNVYEDH